MGRVYERIDDRLARFIEDQPVFFVATAPLDADGLINCSPKGNRHELAVVAPDRVAFLDQTGSGIETVAHLADNGRIVLMVCAFDGPPRILRLHGHGRAHPPGSPAFAALAPRFQAADGVGVRSIIEIDVERIADSCGYGVPLMTFTGHRPTMTQWSDRKGPEGIAGYQTEKNARSLDGLAGLPAIASGSGSEKGTGP
jgi:hypothetical protein